MKKVILIVGGFLIVGGNVFSQDLHFSQYNENPSLLNPALTGSSYVMRASVIYKDQWRSVTVPYKTFGASFDMKFKASNWDKVDPFKTRTFKKSFNRLSGGLSFYSDKAGDGNMGTNLVNLSFATFIKGGEHSSFSLGLQGSGVQKTIDYSKLIFSNQYNGSTGYDQTIANGEQYGAKSFFYLIIAMNLTELARLLKVSPNFLREKLPALGFDIGLKAIKVDNQTARKILQQWPAFIRRQERQA